MRSEIEKMKKSPLVTIKSRLDFIYLAYAISLGLIILFSFMGVMVDEVNNSLNIYGWIRGILNANLFLAVSLLELVFVLKRKEKTLIFLRILNSLWLFKLLLDVVKGVVQSRMAATSYNVFAGIVQFTSGFLSGWSPNMERANSADMLNGYYLVLYSTFFSLILLLVYCYFKYIKKETLTFEFHLSFLSVEDIKKSYAKNKLLTVASISISLSQFLYFYSLPGTINKTVSPFTYHAILALIILVLAILVVSSIARGEEKRLDTYIISLLVSFVVYNPIYIFQHGRPGLGYIVYIFGWVLFSYYLVDKKWIQAERNH
jgi:membrane protein